MFGMQIQFDDCDVVSGTMATHLIRCESVLSGLGLSEGQTLNHRLKIMYNSMASMLVIIIEIRAPQCASISDIQIIGGKLPIRTIYIRKSIRCELRLLLRKNKNKSKGNRRKR